ncbi:hypothetical protein QQG74_28225 [Micromonospora sp. FIMYZ51]|uniref:hypothetical protein n=1 Tax=Micromonospora sp. FIMYZ51 TaxID=3051832 RepID=UPI00311E34EB
MAYWWSDDPTQRYWVEIRKRPGIGTQLWAPTRDEDGGVDGWYNLVSSVAAGDTIYHWNAVESRFVGRSFAALDARIDAQNDAFVVDLTNFTPLRADLSLEFLRSRADRLYVLRDELRNLFGDPLYLPWQFKEDRSKFSSMSNYFAKLPKQAVPILFGKDGLGGGQVESAPTADVPAANSVPLDSPQADQGWAFLDPFKPKADADYFSKMVGGSARRGRRHETLVNACAKWLADNGFVPGRNAAIDLGVAELGVIIEAKVVQKSWAKAIREAVGQLYEYRYFRVADPESSLIFMADRPVPQMWTDYLEKDRGIGAMWPDGDGFAMSKIAARALTMH